MGLIQQEEEFDGSNRIFVEIMVGVARGIIHIHEYNQSIQEEKPTLTDIRIKCDPDDEKGVLIILKGYWGSVDHVAFHRDVTITSALVGVGNRLRNGSLQWREETPYVGNG